MKNDERLIIGIGDMHGHYPALESLLTGLQERYEIFNDKRLRYNVQLVFTGDYIDRGESNLKIINTLIGLSSNYNVVELFGNHELMALASLDIAKNLAARNATVSDYQCCSLHGINGGEKFVSEFSDDSSLALKNYVVQMNRESEIGRWMRNLKPFYLTTFNSEKILFVHGGLSRFLSVPEDLESYSAYFNQRMQTTTSVMGGYSKKFFDSRRLGPEGPFWDRSMHSMSEKQIKNTLEKLEIDRVVLAHTPHKKIINYIDRVFDIDVGMTPKYGGNSPTAIIFKSGGIYSFSSGCETKLADFS